MWLNEIDRYAVAWLRELIAAGELADGVVDERDIKEVAPADVEGQAQCHFFAGIGGWPYALRLAGWPDDAPVWTGSCPCQPFSTAGKRTGGQDERHLWPAWRELIRECRPPVVFGEQVASSLGRSWLARVRVDLEAMGYAIGAADLCAACVGAPHIRQRLFWVADATDERTRERSAAEQGGDRADYQVSRADGDTCGLADADRERRAERAQRDGGEIEPGQLTSFWDDSVGCRCADERTRRTPAEPALFPLADGVPGRVGLLRGAGNAIVPQVAAAFVRAFMEADMTSEDTVGAIARGVPMPDFYRWRWGTCGGKYPELGRRKGKTCRLVARGRRNSCLIEFADGARFVTSRNGVQKK